MTKIFDISQFDQYREDNRREVKKAKDGLPISLWDTYSAFANCYGGVIILGVKEENDGSWKTTGLKNASKLCKDFWDTINNSRKVNINLLSEDDVQTYEVGENKDVIMVIYVPMAKREQKPVYINNDIFNGTFRRNYEGDYHCTRLQVKTMLRDQTERTMDMEVLDKVPMEDLNYDTIHGYRNSHRTLKEGHPFERLNDHEYLRSIGAAAISNEDGQLHPTAAGMLMFGDEYNIVRHFPEYFLEHEIELTPGLMQKIRKYNKSQNARTTTIYTNTTNMQSGLVGYSSYDDFDCDSTGMNCKSRFLRGQVENYAEVKVTGCAISSGKNGYSCSGSDVAW